MYEVQINVNQKDLQTIKTKKENKQLVKDALRKSDTARERVVDLMIRCRGRHGKYSLRVFFSVNSEISTRIPILLSMGSCFIQHHTRGRANRCLTEERTEALIGCKTSI